MPPTYSVAAAKTPMLATAFFSTCTNSVANPLPLAATTSSFPCLFHCFPYRCHLVALVTPLLSSAPAAPSSTIVVPSSTSSSIYHSHACTTIASTTAAFATTSFS
ncbi:hypothetical protein B296_00033676 [Ensete ventricosum]|uniref:Uncharacterized protein n=1 Tax=Ensete ventricosum TaxID=4639 RepID=A0A426ZP09_ENSVE|nr:hypothetical protein B296_00033676 [Ensete ventricosum]